MKFKFVFLLGLLFASAVSFGQTKLDYLKKIPDTMKVWGCGGRYTYDTTKMEENNYVFWTSGTDRAIIRINNTDIYLNKSADDSTNNKIWLLIYKGQGCKVSLKLKMLSSKYLVNYYTGLLEILYSGHKFVYKIHGEYGC